MTRRHRGYFTFGIVKVSRPYTYLVPLLPLHGSSLEPCTVDHVLLLPDRGLGPDLRGKNL